MFKKIIKLGDIEERLGEPVPQNWHFLQDPEAFFNNLLIVLISFSSLLWLVWQSDSYTVPCILAGSSIWICMTGLLSGLWPSFASGINCFRGLIVGLAWSWTFAHIDAIFSSVGPFLSWSGRGEVILLTSRRIVIFMWLDSWPRREVPALVLSNVEEDVSVLI